MKVRLYEYTHMVQTYVYGQTVWVYTIQSGPDMYGLNTHMVSNKNIFNTFTANDD